MPIIEQCRGEGFFLTHSIDSHPVDEWFEYHIHDSYELFCLVKGKVGYVVEGHVYKLRAGAILLMRGAETHKLIVNESDEYERYVLNFRPELFKSFSASLLKPYTERELGVRNLYLPSELDISPVFVFEKIFRDEKHITSTDATVANIAALLSSINVAFSNTDTRALDTKDTLGGSIISYVNDNLTSDISLEKISNEIHLSPSQISRIFKRITGTSVYDYILSKRLLLFQEKLSSGKNAIEASQECGFRDYSSFYRLYKKRFGFSPTKSGK